jgi:hypothetical protein
MRTKPSGSRCSRKQRKNSSSDRVSNFCSLLWAESRQRNVTFPSANETRRWLGEAFPRWCGRVEGLSDQGNSGSVEKNLRRLSDLDPTANSGSLASFERPMARV